MQKNRRICRQADALIVGGQTFESLLQNLREVFKRLQKCGMTIKPSKLIICPKKTVLFGWEFSEQAWRPSPHKINPLLTAAQPNTVKQLRSWLGASKQLSSVLVDYAKVFKPLEKTSAGKSSGDISTWTEEETKHFHFTNAKSALKDVKSIQYPMPEDQINTFSDFSQDSCYVGGRLEFTGVQSDGPSKTYHGGFFSACLNNNQIRWLPCEVECLGVKLVLDHFWPILQESKKT